MILLKNLKGCGTKNAEVDEEKRFRFPTNLSNQKFVEHNMKQWMKKRGS